MLITPPNGFQDGSGVNYFVLINYQVLITGGMLKTTLDIIYFLGGMLETTQNANYSTGGMVETTLDVNYSTRWYPGWLWQSN